MSEYCDNSVRVLLTQCVQNNVIYILQLHWELSNAFRATAWPMGSKQSISRTSIGLFKCTKPERLCCDSLWVILLRHSQYTINFKVQLNSDIYFSRVKLPLSLSLFVCAFFYYKIIFFWSSFNQKERKADYSKPLPTHNCIGIYLTPKLTAP